MTETRRPRGRPTVYTEELAHQACEMLAEGRSLAEIERAGVVRQTTVHQWVQDDREGFAARYARARKLQAQTLADGAVELARNGPSGDPQAARVQLDALKWAAAKLDPARYGDRLEVRGSVDLRVSQMSDDELRQPLAEELVAIGIVVPAQLLEDGAAVEPTRASNCVFSPKG